MKKILQILIFITFSLNLSAQNLIIDSDLKVESTNLKFISRDKTRIGFSSFDNKKTDSLIVYIGSSGFTVLSLKINFNNEMEPILNLWSDAPDYNGKNSLDVELEFYELTLNKTEFNIGDRIIGKIYGKSKIITDQAGEYQVLIDGEFSHIIGKVMTKRKAEHNYYIRDGK